MSATCPNLKELFGDRYRIGHDPAAQTWGDRADPWMMQIRCRGQGVTIYPHGEGLLAVQCDNRRGMAKRLVEMGLTLHQDGDREKTFLFPVPMFEEVAKITQPLRRPALTDQRRAELATHMEVVRAKKIATIGAKFASKPVQAGI